MNYCNEGETATVTFPDGSVESFSDTPIEISCVPIQGIRCQAYTGTITVRYNSGVSCQNCINTYQVDPFWGEYLPPPYRRPTNPATWAAVIARGRTTRACRSDLVETVIFSRSWIAILEILDWNFYPVDETVLDPPTVWWIRVFGATGQMLFSAEFQDCNYSVECLGCPPRTINCGDCCLDCQSTFNSISSLRNMIRQLERGAGL
jgi:hypothetical protein